MAGGSAGSLVVKLGLDAAEYTQGLSKAEYQARKFGESIGAGIRASALVGAAAITSVGAAALAANAAFNKLLDGAAKFQDLSEETGASAVSIAGLSVAAATAGVSIESVAGSMNKLTKNLVGVDDESKAAGAALAALDINVKDFKALEPAAQYDAVSRALAGFADGAGKTAVAMALFGKSGAEQLKVLKALEEQGGATNILTAEQIALADEYRDAQAKLTAELSLYASALATNFIGPVNALKAVLAEAISGLSDTGAAVNSLGVNTGVQVFAENAGRALAGMIDYVKQSVNELRAITDFVTSSATAIGQAASFDFSGVRKTGEEFRARYGLDELGRKIQSDSGKQAAQTFVQSYNATLAASKRSAFNAIDPRRVDLVNGQPAAKSALNFGGAVKPEKAGKKDNSAVQEAKSQLASDLDAIKNAQEAVTNTYANQEKILEALRYAGLKEEGAYYQEKQRLIAQTATAQEDALQKQIARLQQENLSGKDAIDNAKKVADAEAKLQKVREDSAAAAQVLGIQQEAATKRIAAAFLSAQQAAQDFFDTTNRGYAREIAGIGQGSKNRNFSSGITQIEDKYRQQRQDLQNQRSQQELSGGFGPEAQKQFDAQLSLINEFQTKAVDSYKGYYDTLNEAQGNWLNGATEALNNYADEASNVAKHTEEVFSNAFKGLEDQFTNLLSGKKFDGKKLLEDLRGDVTRNVVKENITGPLAGLSKDFLGFDLFGGGKGAQLGSSPANALYVRSADPLGGVGGALTGSGSGGLLSNIFGAAASAYGGFGNGTATSMANLSGGGLDDLFKYAGNFMGRASGGTVRPFGIHAINENGPELLDVNGKQYLMNGNKSASITANHKISDGGGYTQNIQYVVEGRIDRRTQTQLADETRRKTQAAAVRFA